MFVFCVLCVAQSLTVAVALQCRLYIFVPYSSVDTGYTLVSLHVLVHKVVNVVYI